MDWDPKGSIDKGDRGEDGVVRGDDGVFGDNTLGLEAAVSSLGRRGCCGAGCVLRVLALRSAS